MLTMRTKIYRKRRIEKMVFNRQISVKSFHQTQQRNVCVWKISFESNNFLVFSRILFFATRTTEIAKKYVLSFVVQFEIVTIKHLSFRFWSHCRLAMQMYSSVDFVCGWSLCSGIAFFFFFSLLCVDFYYKWSSIRVSCVPKKKTSFELRTDFYESLSMCVQF